MNNEQTENMNYEVERYIPIDDIKINSKLKYKTNFIKEYIMKGYFITSISAYYDSFNNKIEFRIRFGFKKIGLSMDAKHVEITYVSDLAEETKQLIDTELLKQYKKGIFDE